MLTTAALNLVFHGKAPRFEALPLDEELALIAAARAGDQSAFDALLRQYTPGIRALVGRERSRTSQHVDIDEGRADALLAFVEAVHSARDGERVGPQLDPCAKRVSDDYNIATGMSVPGRTQRRYLQAHRAAAANGTRPIDEARALTMSADTFYRVADANAFDSTERLVEAAREEGVRGTADHVSIDRGYATVEQKATVAAAFAAIADDPRATVVIRDYYGFNDYEQVPDAEIAHRRGLTRQTVQRARTEGVKRMRVALGADESEAV